MSNIFNNIVKEALVKEFKGDCRITRVSEDLAGKVIVLYGGNNLGKTKQSSKFKNPIFLPVEQGLNGINGAMALTTTDWLDLKRNGKKLKKLAKREFSDLLKGGEQITIVIDGIERIGTYAQNFLEAKYDVSDIGKANGGYGCWSEYAKMIWNWVDGLVKLGYTIVFIGHEKIDKKKEKYVIDGDERNIKPIRDLADIVAYLQSNGVDENGEAIPSSAYFYETDEYFARTRYEYMDGYLETFTAEGFEKIVVDGIKAQNKAEGFDSVNFEEQQSIYRKDKEPNLEELVAEIKEMYDKIAEHGDSALEDYMTIVENNLGADTKVSDATKKHIPMLVGIRDDLEDLIDDLEE